MEKENGKKNQFLAANIIALILFATYIAFHSFFEKHITVLLVDNFLCYLNSTWINDCLAILFFFLIIYHFKESRKFNSYISNQILFLSILFFIVIIYYRFFANTWSFTSMFIYSKVKYIDLIFIFCILIFVARILYKKNEYPYDSANGFFFDNPINNENEDELGRSILAKKISEKIKNTASDDTAFAIGICSEWGQGKTSLLELIKSNLYDKHRIVIDFNPWLNNDECSIIISFFDELSYRLTQYNKELSKDLIEYAEILNVAENSNIDKILSFFKLSNSKSLKQKYDSLNNKISNLGKQIVVFIDNLDRLYDKEILEVLRLIRNSASFANTIFIVAYDRNYLISALKKVNEFQPNLYLEKIFQLEIMLPKFEKYIIANKLKAAIEPFLTDKDKIELEELLETGYHRNFNYTLFSNIRDINRFVNSFILSYEILKGEIDLLDLLNLELLRIRYLGVYNLLSKDYNDFVKSAKQNDNDKDYYLCLRKLKDKNEDKKLLEKTAFEEYLETHFADVGILKNQINDVLKYVALVFPFEASNKGNIGNTKYSLLSIRNPIAVERYFHYKLLNSNLSEKEFSEYRFKTDCEFHAKINEWIEKNLSQEVANRFERIEHFQNREEYEKIINAIFFFASIPFKNSIPFKKHQLIGFDYDNLLSKLKYENVKMFYTKEEYKTFINELFNCQKSPYLFVSEFINSIFRESDFHWNFEGILSEDELINRKLFYFKRYAEEITTIDDNFFSLYHYCGYLGWIDNGNASRSLKDFPPSQSAKDIFKQCAERLMDSFIPKIISMDTRFDEKKHFSIRRFVCNVWDSWENFEKFLLEFDERQVQSLKEFKDLFYKCKEVDFNYVEYNFKEIDFKNVSLLNN